MHTLLLRGPARAAVLCAPARGATPAHVRYLTAAQGQAAAAAPLADPAPAAAPAVQQPRQARAPAPADRVMVRLSPDSTQDKRVLGMVLGRLRSDNPIAQMETKEGDAQLLHRAVRVLVLTSKILATEQPDKHVEVLFARRTRKAVASEAGSREALAVPRIRVTALLKPGALPQPQPLAPSSVPDEVKNGELKVSKTTKADGLTSAIISRIKKLGVATAVASGPDPVNVLVQAVQRARTEIRSNLNSSLSVYLSAHDIADGAEGKGLGPSTCFTILPTPLLKENASGVRRGTR